MPSITPQRKFKGTDVDMLTTSSVIIDNAITHQDYLVTKRSVWAGTFFSNIQLRIDAAVNKYIGVDTAKNLRNATAALRGIQKQALNVLALLNVQITQDFKKMPERRDELLNTLGFKDYYRDASAKNQAALIKLLFNFKQNIDATIKAEMVAKGATEADITALVGFADTLQTANVKQESFKTQRPTITAEAITELNNIYDDVIAIAKITAKIYKDNPTVKASFSYSKVLAAQKAATTTKSATATSTTAGK
ncbi:MAG: hypothetical protein QM541_17070 [Flavobacterium sp.]|nr:hypothetical protein [Flavobacterium sp.]